jgi:hypothetical protein
MFLSSLFLIACFDFALFFSCFLLFCDRLDEMSKPRSRDGKAKSALNSSADNLLEDEMEITESVTSKGNTVVKKDGKQQPQPNTKGVAVLRPPLVDEHEEESSALSNRESPASSVQDNVVKSSLALLKTRTLRGRTRTPRENPLSSKNEDNAIPAFFPPEKTENDNGKFGFTTSSVSVTQQTKQASKPLSQTSQLDDRRYSSSRKPVVSQYSEEEDEEEDDQYEREEDDNFDEDDNQYGKSSYDFEAAAEEEGDADALYTGPKIECSLCGRSFAEKPFQIHSKICKKVFASKRKVFDSSKKRIEGIPELKEVLEKTRKSSNKGLSKQNSRNDSTMSVPAANNSNASKWKEQSKQFRMAMQAARQFASGSDDADVLVGGAPASVPYVDPSFIQCPNCERRFNGKAAERHIPLCKNIRAKPSVLKKGSGSSTSSTKLSSTSTTTTNRR